MASIPKHHNVIERQPWLGAVPIYELVDGVPIATLRIGAA
jgi:hypothetical protein